MGDQNSQPQRFFSPDLDTLWEGLGTRPEPQVMVCEHVYFDTGHPSMAYTGFVRGRRVVEDDDLFGDGGGFSVEHRPTEDDPIHVHPEPMALEEVPAVIAEEMGLGDLKPFFGVRFERHRYEVRGIRVDVDIDVTYFSLLGEEPMEVGREDTPRVTARNITGNKKHDRRIEQALEEVSRSPYTTKKWMGFHFMKTAYELPRHDDLAGFEYELKLEVDSLEIDTGRLPFPVLEVHQNDSLRRYYRDTRASVRGESAHLVEKGPVRSVGGILRRAETKKRGLDPTTLPPPKMVMRRYKREINVFNPDNGRVYTLSLHHCVAGRTFQQLEIEYDGRLVPGAVSAMARFRVDHDTRHFLRMASRADGLEWGYLGDDLRERYLRLTPEAPDEELVRSSMTKHRLEPNTDPDPDVEREVIDDMRLLRQALVQHGFRPSRKTKRKWLRKVYASRDG